MSDIPKKKKKSRLDSVVGRPSKYKEQYCQELIDFMGEGYSYEAFAAKIKVSDVSLYHWEVRYPEFLRAKKVAFQASRLFWEKQGIDGLWVNDDYDESGKKLSTRRLNSTAWIFNMKNRFNWSDRVQQEVETKVTLETLIDESQDPQDKDE